VTELNNLNVNYLKIPKMHRGLEKMLSRATCGTRVAGLRPLIWVKRLRKWDKAEDGESSRTIYYVRTDLCSFRNTVNIEVIKDL